MNGSLQLNKQVLKSSETRKQTEMSSKCEQRYLAATTGACRLHFREVLQVASLLVHHIVDKNSKIHQCLKCSM